MFAALPAAEALFMAAAVADYRPAAVAAQKIKKGSDALTLSLTRTTDVLGALAQRRAEFPNLRLVVGFAAESQALLENARSKLQRKGLNLIVANDITAPQAGFAVDTNRVTLLYADGLVEALPLMSKAEVAQAVVLRGLVLLEGGYLVHLAAAAAWQQAQENGAYRPPSLESKGFIHLSRPGQVESVRQRFYARRQDMVMLKVPYNRIAEPVRWEAADGDVFPHLYAPLPVEAVAAAEPLA